MSIECGRVSAADVAEQVAALRVLAQRAEDHEQTFLFIALNLAAESLADNAYVSFDMEGGDDVEHG